MFAPALIYSRPHYQAPLTRIIDPVTHEGATRVKGSAATTRDWVLRTGPIDKAGHKLSRLERTRVNRQAHAAGVELPFYLRRLSLRQFVEYQPAGRFWTFQLIEAGLLLGLALPLMGTAIWAVRRHTN